VYVPSDLRVSTTPPLCAHVPIIMPLVGVIGFIPKAVHPAKQIDAIPEIRTLVKMARALRRTRADGPVAAAGPQPIPRSPWMPPGAGNQPSKMVQVGYLGLAVERSADAVTRPGCHNLVGACHASASGGSGSQERCRDPADIRSPASQVLAILVIWRSSGGTL
jgi:hypothetical protein